MKDRIKGYILISSIVGTAIVSFNGMNNLLNDVYKPDQNFTDQKAKQIKTGHKFVAGVFALNNTVAVANIMGKIMYRH